MPPLSEALRKRGERPREPTFDRLMRAGRDLFTEEGFAATSLDAVAAAGGVTKGSLYHHFSSKTELFEAVFEEEARRLCEQIAQVVAKESDPWDGTYAGIRSFLKESQDPAVQRIMFLDAPSVLGWGRVREVDAEYGLALVKLALERLVASGQIPGQDLNIRAHLLFAALIEAAQLIARADNPATARRKIERELRLFMDGLASSPR